MADDPVEAPEVEAPKAKAKAQPAAPDDLCLHCDRSLSTVEWCPRCGFQPPAEK
jgi:hypothetical protein